MKKNFFNVIIPTRNRLETLRHSLKTVLKQDYENYKIIISDNFSTDGTRDFVESLDSKNIDYFNTGRSLSMSSNYEFAISKISEGFVILIGDDDGLLPSALQNINNIINTEKTLAISSATVFYYWQGASPYQDLLMIPRKKAVVKRRTSKEYLKKVLNHDLNYSELPMLYTGGVVHTSLIEKAKSDGNKFYNSMTPDVYSAIAIASVVSEYTRVEKPFAISGLSRYSNGQSQLGLNQDATIAQKFFQENDIPFHPVLGDGKIKSIHLLTLEAYIQSGFLRHGEVIDMARQYEIVIAKTPKNLRNEIRAYLKLHCDFNPALISISWLRISVLKLNYYLGGIVRRFKNLAAWDMLFVKGKINNVYEASEYIDKVSLDLMRSILYRLIYKFKHSKNMGKPN